MKKTGTHYLKWAICAGLVGLLATFSCKTHYPLANERFTLIKSPSSLERGKNLAYNVCGGCHYNKSLRKFVGHKMNDLPKFMGKVYSANLTHSKAYGVLSKYTDAELAYLIKTGIKNDGRFIPYMIRPTMAEEDINDIIVYLRSDDAAVSAADTSVGHTHLNMFGKAANHTQKPQPYIEGIKRPGENDAIANGRYLVDIIGCYHCHSKGILSLKYTHPEQSKGYMQGGMKFKTPQGNKIRAANLTPDKGTGIGRYTKDEFRKAVREGETPDGRKLNFPMPKFKHLTDKQADDIYAYLETLPARYHKTR